MSRSIRASAYDVVSEALFWEYPFAAWIYERTSLEIIAANDAAAIMYDREAQDFLGTTLPQLVPPGAARDLHATLTAVLDDRRAAMLPNGWTEIRSDGSTLARDLVLSRSFIRSGRSVRCLYLVDASPSRDEFDRLNPTLHLDRATGLLNRTALERRMGEDLPERCTAVGLLRLAWADTAVFGGSLTSTDELHAAIGDLLGENATVALDIFAIDEHTFAFIFESASGARSARPFLRHLVHLFQSPICVGEKRIVLRPAIGFALRAPTTDRAYDLLSDARHALEAALSRNEPFVEFDREVRLTVTRRVEIDRALRGATERQEFDLAYQPIIALADGCVIGIEALLRWTSPTLGRVAPAEFIRVAEETGSIERIGEWVMDRAFSDYTRLPLSGQHKPRLCMNISARQLRQRDFYGVLTAAASRYGMLWTDLELEISEKTIRDDVAGSFFRLLHGVRQRGTRISLDDFGTASSSLAHLSALPLDSVKIDATYVRSLPTDDTKRTIVRCIIELANHLGVHVIGEGIEDARESDALRGLGAHAVQGYALAKPMASADLLGFLASYERYRLANAIA